MFLNRLIKQEHHGETKRHSYVYPILINMYSHRKMKDHQMFLDRLIKHAHKLKKKTKKSFKCYWIN